jgi:4-hydroxy-2-oxoglutarate aldolase
MKKAEGIFAPAATPFKPDAEQSIDFEKLSDNISKLSRTGLAGITALGSNGEFTMLSRREKLEIVAAIRKSLPGDRLLIAGTGCESLRDTVELTKGAADSGADVALVINPSYYKRDLSEAALEKFFVSAADASPIPIMIYNMPGNSGINLSSGLVTKLAGHENITGVKDSGGNIVQISEIIAGSPSDFSVFAGSGSYLFATTALGGKGGTLAVANVAPDLCADIYALCRKGDISSLERARRIQLEILKLNACVTSLHGIGGMKAAMDMAGFSGGLPRHPLQPASAAAAAEIRQELEKLGILGKYK